MDLVEQSLHSLEWPQLLKLFAQHCYSEPGKEIALSTSAAANRADAEYLLNCTAEAMALVSKESFSILNDLPALKESLIRLRKEQILDGGELISLHRLLEVAIRVRELIEKNQKSSPLLHTLTLEIASLPGEAKAISHVLEPDGRVKDSASPKLRSLRDQERKLHSSAREKLDEVLQRAFRDGFLQDRFFDQRDGRYLIPVKTEHRLKIPGHVVESSHTKATVFMEPAALRDLNDGIKQIQLDIQEEIYLILCTLCERLFPHAEAINTSYLKLLEIEQHLGRGRLAQYFADTKGVSKPAFTSQDILLEGLYHPLLPQVISAEKIVRNSFELSQNKRILVISGPNTGGKTVLLKAVGLSAQMAKAGFFLSCDGESKVPFFQKIVSQVGDSQSLEQSLSSFSACVKGLLEIIEASSKDTLILIDEILHSTDPDEAAALSQAILNHFYKTGATAVVTTHLNGLKVANTQSFANASMEFSSDTMRPSYRLRMGIPGSSRAIEIATQLGLQRDLAEEAKQYLGQNQQRYDELLNALEDRERKLNDANEALEHERGALAAEQTKVSELKSQLVNDRQNFQSQAREKLREQEREARLKLEEMIQLYKDRLQDLNAKQGAALEAKEKIKELKESFTPKEEIKEKDTADDTLTLSDGFEIRGLVYVQHLKNQGTLLSDPADRRKPAEVQVGTLRLRVEWDKLTPLSRKGKPILRKSSYVEQSECAPEINLIGKTVDEALDRARIYLDQAARSGRPSVRIVHGHGSGALKKAIRGLLSDSGYDLKFRAGNNHEGGEGCTVVEFDR